MAVSPHLAGQLLLFARAVVNEHKRRLSRQYPPASVRGEYPARRTGNLWRSTVARPLSAQLIQRTGRVAVGYLDRAFYGVILKAKGRLSLDETIVDVIRTRVRGGALPRGIVWTRNDATFPG